MGTRIKFFSFAIIKPIGTTKAASRRSSEVRNPTAAQRNGENEKRDTYFEHLREMATPETSLEEAAIKRNTER